MSGYGMGCICLVKVWDVYVWLWYGMYRSGHGTGCIGLVKVWDV
jgi:hypothetical protein